MVPVTAENESIDWDEFNKKYHVSKAMLAEGREANLKYMNGWNTAFGALLSAFRSLFEENDLNEDSIVGFMLGVEDVLLDLESLGRGYNARDTWKLISTWARNHANSVQYLTVLDRECRNSD